MAHTEPPPTVMAIGNMPRGIVAVTAGCGVGIGVGVGVGAGVARATDANVPQRLYEPVPMTRETFLPPAVAALMAEIFAAVSVSVRVILPALVDVIVDSVTTAVPRLEHVPRRMLAA